MIMMATDLANVAWIDEHPALVSKAQRGSKDEIAGHEPRKRLGVHAGRLASSWRHDTGNMPAFWETESRLGVTRLQMAHWCSGGGWR